MACISDGEVLPGFANVLLVESGRFLSACDLVHVKCNTSEQWWTMMITGNFEPIHTHH
jgi:hypothetical protein